MRNWQTIEKHNVLAVIERNGLLEFSKDRLHIEIEKNYKSFITRYYNLEDILQELLHEGKITAKYISVKVEPKIKFWNDKDIMANPRLLGSKTKAIYYKNF
jgi:hypothetical protein